VSRTSIHLPEPPPWLPNSPAPTSQVSTTTDTHRETAPATTPTSHITSKNPWLDHEIPRSDWPQTRAIPIEDDKDPEGTRVETRRRSHPPEHLVGDGYLAPAPPTTLPSLDPLHQVRDLLHHGHHHPMFSTIYTMHPQQLPPSDRYEIEELVHLYSLNSQDFFKSLLSLICQLIRQIR
jgi:hypothetical protein